jgi:16S rRNA (guanine527-N7)-methyltransferase
VFHVKPAGPPDPIPPEQEAKLRTFEGLLRSVAVPRGFISARDAARLRDRHIEDSLRARPCLGAHSELAFDIGSGAGLPGIPIAIVMPQLRMVLIEPARGRAAFIELAVEHLALPNVEVVVRRAQEVGERADACVARALGSASASWTIAAPLLRPGGRLVYFAGRNWSLQDAEEAGRAGAVARICAPPDFPWQGPIVIMSHRS